MFDVTKIWLIVCKEVGSNEYSVFRNVSDDALEKEKFFEYAKKVTTWIGHNWLGYDYPTLCKCIGFTLHDVVSASCDTLVVSRLVDYSRKKQIGNRKGPHSLEDYGLEFKAPKGDYSDWSKYTPEMEEYCKRDVDITEKIYTKYTKYLSNTKHTKALELEHSFQLICNSLSDNGFTLDIPKCTKLLSKVEEELKVLDTKLTLAFPPTLRVIRTVIPKGTKYGTINLTSIPKEYRSDLTAFEIGVPFEIKKEVEFNFGSPKQVVQLLWDAGWNPTSKTKSHIETERELQRLKYHNNRSTELDLQIELLHNKLQSLKKTGWKIDEENLDTLPSSAPEPARLLAQRIMLESRRKTLTEWLGLVKEDGRIHGKFFGIGAWTHRMAHQEPNTANIPNEFETSGKKKPLGKEMRSLWIAPKNRLLVGVDAESIQLRIFAHYINDPDFSKALAEGNKKDKTDAHSFNQGILGPACKSRAAAKRFIFALLLGAGIGKLREILGCELHEAEEALERLIVRYEGFALLKREVIPSDARRGWFTGLDGRSVAIPSPTLGGRKHLAMSGYLQCGEAVVMKRATVKWHSNLKDYDAKLVNFVHDEWQVECPNNLTIALEIAKMMADSLREVGEELKLNCPLGGSYKNDHEQYTFGTNWYQTH